MKKRMLLISLILAVLAATLVFAYLQSLEKSKEVAGKVTILVANVTIQARTLIDAKMIGSMEVPDSDMVKDYIKDSTLVVGKYAKSTIEKNEGFLVSKLMDKSESTDEITVKIAKNHRAISINVNGESGVSKLVKPGDHVDVFMYLAEKKENQGVSRPDLSSMLLQNVEVLAIDRRLVREGSVVDQEKDAIASFLVTLSVKVDDVGKLVLAEDIGSLKLVLRSDEKEKPYVPKTVTEDELFSSSTSKATPTPKSTVKSTPKPASTTKPASTVKPVTTATEKPKSQSSPKPTSTSNKSSTTKYKYYTVKTGDTLMSISRMFYKNSSDYSLIIKANNINDDNHIEIGSRLKIPVK